MLSQREPMSNARVAPDWRWARQDRRARCAPKRLVVICYGAWPWLNLRRATSARHSVCLPSPSVVESARRRKSEQFRKDLEPLERLRDEIRVRMHLAGMEVRRRWNDLQPRIDDLPDSAKRLGEASVEAAKEPRELTRELLRARLNGAQANPGR